MSRFLKQFRLDKPLGSVAEEKADAVAVAVAPSVANAQSPGGPGVFAKSKQDKAATVGIELQPQAQGRKKSK